MIGMCRTQSTAWGAMLRFTITSVCTNRWTIKRRQASTGTAKPWQQRPPSIDRRVVLTLGSTLYLRLFSGLHIAVFVAFLALWIQPTDVDPRFGLGAAALFAAVASEFVVASSLPETNILTLADQLHMASLGFIFLSLIESAVSLPLCRANAVASRRLDRISF